ncbi:MAG: hypothetical protein JOZ75_13155 [Candidatus Dormibacteraeota bacterium]|nr:hypothetical protein [Candidatus Dormibacteraeota bacterium]
MSAVDVAAHAQSQASRDDKPKSIDYLHWRDEILQVMYWLNGEGLGDAPSAAQIQNFVGASEDIVVSTLERMVEDGFVVNEAGGFRLSDFGRHEGGRSFEDEFHALTHQGHGECSPNCEFCNGPGGDPSNCPSKGVAHSAPG